MTENTDEGDGQAANVLVADNAEGPDQGNEAENVAENVAAIVAGDPHEVRVINPDQTDEAPIDMAETDETELKKNT